MRFRTLKILFVFILIFIGPQEGLGSSLESFLPKKDLPQDWALIDGPHLYNKKTLFEHINGQAELFLQYGFQKSVFAIYQDRKNPDHQLEVDIYDMGNVLQAFGVFSRFRNEEKPGGFGLDSYLNENSAFFYQGRYFSNLYTTKSNASVLKRFATLVSSKITDRSSPPKEIGYFPKSGLKPGSIQYFPKGLLGHQFLKSGFQGTYREQDKDKAHEKEFKLFLAAFKNAEGATSGLMAYKDYLSKKGKVNTESISKFESKGLRGEDPYQGKVMVLPKGFYLLGAVGFEKEVEAENRLTELMGNVK
ncbi:MAG: DUF6599 family protein [Thermodesulfobacteriota bacterium]